MFPNPNPEFSRIRPRIEESSTTKMVPASFYWADRREPATRARRSLLESIREPRAVMACERRDAGTGSAPSYGGQRGPSNGSTWDSAVNTYEARSAGKKMSAATRSLPLMAVWVAACGPAILQG